MKHLLDLLGLPKYTREFTLHVKYGELPTIVVTYYPEEKGTSPGGDTITKKFKLVEDDDAAAA